MNIEIEQRDGITIITPDDDIDLYNVSKIRQILKELHDQQKYKLIIDLHKVSFIDSSGLSIFVKEMTILQKQGEILKLCNVGETIKRLFKWTTVNMHTENYTSLYDAIQSYQ